MGGKGISLVIVIFVTTIVILLGTTLLNMSTSEYMMACYARDYTAAYYMAEGGLQKALTLLKEMPDYRGETGWQSLGEGRYKFKVSQGSGTSNVAITSTGKVNVAEVAITVRANVYVETVEESDSDPPEEYVIINILSWDYKGPI